MSCLACVVSVLTHPLDFARNGFGKWGRVFTAYGGILRIRCRPPMTAMAEPT